MIHRLSFRIYLLSLTILAWGILGSTGRLSSAAAQQAPTTAAAQAGFSVVPRDADLEYVVALSRHGVRPPLSKPGAIDRFSAAPWPQWEVQPGYLTPHGYQILKLFGAWDRIKFSSANLFAADGCADAGSVSVFADSNERTIQTAKALVEGMFPGCGIDVHAKPEGTPDPLFSGHEKKGGNPPLIAAAIAGRIGGSANDLTEAYRPQLAALDRVLAGCGREPTTNADRTSIFDVPASAALGPGYSGTLHGPVILAATFTENLLLEYTDGMKNVGWGCVDEATLRYLMQIDAAGWEYGYHTKAVAQMYASNLLDHILKSLQQHVSGKPVAGALGNPGDRLLLIVGHDSNIVTVAGSLGLDWIIDGRVNDTPPGGVLLFEIWRERSSGRRFVRMEYTAQTLDQMREAQPLSASNPPAVAPIFIPGCSGDDLSCTWDGFTAAMRQAIVTRDVK